jgi:elongation factor Ts
MTISMDLIKKLREETGAGVMDAKKALTEAEGDYNKALKFVEARGIAKAEKKSDRETGEGFVGSYIHMTGKIGAMVSLLCETDFVARNEEFRTLATVLAMQVASMQPQNVEELLAQEHIRSGKVIGEMVKGLSGKVGENIVVGELKLIVL